ncbi:NADH dehydrogenase (ubiquinone) complex I, assembly factor 6, partial [Dipsacomyces acuminosporus]
MSAAMHSYRQPGAARLNGIRRYASTSRRAASATPRPIKPAASRSDIEYCRQLVQKYDYDNYLVSLFTPRLAREAVWGIRAMNVELVHIAEATSNQTTAQMRYTYWLNSINSLFDGHPEQTPVSRTVFDATQRFSISKTWLRRLVTEREKTLTKPAFETIKDVETYGERAYACLIHPHLEALGVRDMHADNAARAIGQATAIMNFTRSLPHLLAQGKCDLPSELLQKHGVDLDYLYSNPQPTPNLQEAVFEFATKGYTR